jgi:hypothetical protein
MGYGIRISKAGSDVRTAAEKDLQYYSDAHAWKVIAEGTQNVTLSGSEDKTITITHSLGFVPTFDVWYITVGGSDLIIETPDAGGISNVSIVGYATSTQLKVNMVNLSASSITIALKHKIYGTRIV